MNSKIILVTLIALIFNITSDAQNITDVVRYSVLDPAGTARTMGVGSAFGAMGGDFSVININPAGIADFRKSDFTFTPSLRNQQTTSFFVADAESINRDKSSKLGLDNIGFVIARQPSNSKWTTSNFAFGFSRMADFNRNATLRGSTAGSITTYFAEKANGKSEAELDDFIAFPAYNTGAIFDFDKDNFYETDFPNAEAKVLRAQSISQTGGINELTFGWAGEYNRALNLGVSMGVPFANFNELKIYREDNIDPDNRTFESLQYTENLNTSSVGFNFKLGMTYKILNRIRIAGAFHSPTWFKFTDNYKTNMNYTFTDTQLNSFDKESPDGNFEYNITTPWRVVGSLGSTYKIGEIVGFINADIEQLDYTNASYNGNRYSGTVAEAIYTREVNRQITNKLGKATNVRLGTEFGYKYLRLRFGYSWEQSPFNADDFSNNRLSYGFGVRMDDFYIDLGIRRFNFTQGYNPYTVLDSRLDPLANIQTVRNNAALTVGFKF